MKQLLPAAENIAKCKVLSEGRLNISEALAQLAERNDEHIRIENMPSKTLEVKWAEVHSPRIKMDFADGLVANRLYSKNFQFVGEFLVEGSSVLAKDWQNKFADTVTETIASNTPPSYAEIFSTQSEDGYILYEKFETTKGFNCTWLLEFLIATQACIESNEYLIASINEQAYIIELQANNGPYRAVERYVFNLDFTAMTWEHHTYIIA